MAIYYKFKSARDYDTIAMDGPFISVGILKDKIFESKHLGSGKDLDIVISNAQTNEEYLDETMLIPKNTSVLIRRVPGRPRITVITTQEPRAENKVEIVQPETSNNPVAEPSATNYPEDDWDEFGNDLYSIPETQDTQHNIPFSAVAPAGEKVDEESKLQALIDTPALDWNRQGQDSFGAGRGYGRGMSGRMGGRGGFGSGMERKTPPPGYVCHRCNVPGHFIQHCSTNGDPTYDVKRVKPPTGIPKSMLMATPDGSYSLPSGAVAVLKPNEDAFEKEMEGLPSTTRSVGEIAPELKCPICKEVMKDAALTSKCCFQSFCDKCIRDYIIANSKCVCGAAGVLADDLLPNKTLRDAINRNLEAGNDSTDNAGSVGHIPDLGSSRCPPPKALSPTTSATSKGEKKQSHSNSNNNAALTVKPPMETTEITSGPGASGEVKGEKPVDVGESTQGSMSVKEATAKSSMQPPKEEGQTQAAAGEQVKKKKKKPRMPGTDMQWHQVPDLAGPDYMMQMGPGPQYFNGMQPGFNGMQPGFNGMQPGFNGFHPGFNGFPGPFPGAMPPFMGYPNPMEMAFANGGMNMMHHPDPFAGQGFGFPNIPPPHRDLAEMGNRLNMQRMAIGRDEFEARKAEMLRKRENERRNESEKMFRDGEGSRMMMNNGGGPSASASSINPSKSRQAPGPLPNPDYERRRRTERSSPDHPPSRKTRSPSRDSKRIKSERYHDERDHQRDREKSRHQDIDREHDHRSNREKSRHQDVDREHDHRNSEKSRHQDDERSRSHRSHRDTERKQRHQRKRSEPPPSSEQPAATNVEIDNGHKSSVFARISFPEEESSGKRRKASSSSSASVADPPVVVVGTSVHRHRGKEVEVGDYESSDDDRDRHFKRKKTSSSRYERSPPVVVADVSDDKQQRHSKRGKGERSRV